jgi:hypothetical protein
LNVGVRVLISKSPNLYFFPEFIEKVKEKLLFLSMLANALSICAS